MNKFEKFSRIISAFVLCVLAGYCSIIGIGVLFITNLCYNILYSMAYIILANLCAYEADEILKGVSLW